MNKILAIIKSLLELIVLIFNRNTPENKAKLERLTYEKKRKKLLQDIQDALDNADVDLLRHLRLELQKLESDYHISTGNK
jgi:uncharacterized protein YpiB (UPF0302 family)